MNNFMANLLRLINLAGRFKTSLFAAAAISAILAACYGLRLGPFRIELSPARFYEVKAEIKIFPEAIIVFGDSIVEGASLPSQIGGVRVVNGGVVGAGIDYFRKHVDEFLGAAHPKLIVLAVGINDATSAATAKAFRSRYEEVMRSLSTRAPLALATVTPVKHGPLAASAYDPQLIPLLNAAILEIGADRPVIDLHRALNDGNFTTDGIHLRAEGYKLWLKALLEGIAAAAAEH